jgi:hypothetical protein
VLYNTNLPVRQAAGRFARFGVGDRSASF